MCNCTLITFDRHQSSWRDSHFFRMNSKTQREGQKETANYQVGACFSPFWMSLNLRTLVIINSVDVFSGLHWHWGWLNVCILECVYVCLCKSVCVRSGHVHGTVDWNKVSAYLFQDIGTPSIDMIGQPIICIGIHPEEVHQFQPKPPVTKDTVFSICMTHHGHNWYMKMSANGNAPSCELYWP